jgi:hypothetical protein
VAVPACAAQMPDPASGGIAPGLGGFDSEDAIGEGMESLHSMPTTKCVGKHPVMFSAVAFGDIEKRSRFLECIRYALQPTLVHSAYVKEVDSQEFEVVVLSSKKVDMEIVEDWLDTFNMSVCVIEFENYMQADMVSSISRVHHFGKVRETNFGFQCATKIRRDFHKYNNKKVKAVQCQRLLDETGLHFTVENMFALHVRSQQMRALVRSLEEQLIAERAKADSCRRSGIAAEGAALTAAAALALAAAAAAAAAQAQVVAT